MKLSDRLFLALVLALVALWSGLSHQVISGHTRVIAWDAYGYYLHLPAALTFHDIHDYAFVDDHLQAYSPSDTPYQIFEQDGVRTPTYTIGVAILWLPFYLVADLWSRIDPRFPADGMSQPYQWMVLLAGLFWLGIGLYSLLRFLGGYLRQTTVRVVIGLLALATNLFYYAAVEPGMPHVYLFALYALLLWQLEVLVRSPRPWRGVLLGLTLGVMALCRPSEAIALVLVIGFLWMTCGGWRGALAFLRTNWKMFGLAVLSGLVIISPQMALWKMTTGHWVYNTYAAYGHTFHLTHPHLWTGCSAIVRVAGVHPDHAARPGRDDPPARDARPWAPGMIRFVVVNIWIVLSWHIWWYAGSFGMRALVQSYAVLALPLGLGWEAWTGTTWKRSVIPALACLAAMLNLFQTWQVQEGILKQDGMTRSFYWSTFGEVGGLVPIALAGHSRRACPATLIRRRSPGCRPIRTPADGSPGRRPPGLASSRDRTNTATTITLVLNDTLAREWAGQWIVSMPGCWPVMIRHRESRGPGWWSTSSRKAGKEPGTGCRQYAWWS
ncbi:MAG: hypothetical protein R2787_10275 [Saprospiraceae bacterium]